MFAGTATTLHAQGSQNAERCYQLAPRSFFDGYLFEARARYLDDPKARYILLASAVAAVWRRFADEREEQTLYTNGKTVLRSWWACHGDMPEVRAQQNAEK